MAGTAPAGLETSPMASVAPHPTGRESPFGEDEIIVSKTDLKGRITYANDVFLRVAHFDRKALIGQPHSIIRHPDMPRCVFQLLWETIEAKQEIFAYVVNLAANGDHYWVFAHVTPSIDGAGNVVGYHSSRRKPDKAQVDAIAPLYRMLVEAEDRPASRKEGMHAARAMLDGLLKERGLSYDRFVFSV